MLIYSHGINNLVHSNFVWHVKYYLNINKKRKLINIKMIFSIKHRKKLAIYNLGNRQNYSEKNKIVILNNVEDFI